MFDDNNSNDAGQQDNSQTPVAPVTSGLHGFTMDQSATDNNTVSSPAPAEDNPALPSGPMPPAEPSTPPSEPSTAPTADTSAFASPTAAQDAPASEEPAAVSPPEPSQPVDDSSSAPSEDTEEPATSDEPPAADSDDSGDLMDIKQKALGQLAPLVDHLDQSPEEKFKTTMMMIQASDDKSLIPSAYEAAQQITDEKAKAQALLDVVNEINYFHQQES